MLAIIVFAGAGCERDSLDQMDGIYYRWDDHKVLCAANLDTSADNDLDSVTRGLERARDRGQLIGIYAHDVGHTVPTAKLEAVLAKVQELGLPFVTYPELDDPGMPHEGGVLLSFDDNYIDDWYAARELFQRYHARVTFFVSKYDLATPDQRRKLRALADDGHAIEAHSRRHLRGPRYVEENGVSAYLKNEVLPSLDLLRADGYDPTIFAYPFGMRTAETDRAILKYVTRLRSVSFSMEGAGDPCPN
jgi:peptidoglycan/xylan/chitin deacetylase (PgdA/CDA1 family)